jgi:hypothetical protein
MVCQKLEMVAMQILSTMDGDGAIGFVLNISSFVICSSQFLV